MKNKALITILAIIGLIFGLIGLILSFLPLGTINIVPAAIGLLFAIIAYLISRKNPVRRKLIISGIVISSLAILISIFSQIFIKNKVAEDAKFEKKIEQSAKESTNDLEEALNDLEDADTLQEPAK